MRLLVFQHSAGEPPAAFSAHAAAAGDSVDIVRLFAGDAIPDVDTADALLVMGGPMDVWEEDTYPWLALEKAAMREWVMSGKPCLGICLGHQLLAEALGGKCAPMRRPEITGSGVSLDDVTDDPLMKVLPNHFPAMHWHGVEVASVPSGATVLGHSEGCANQVMRVGPAAWGLQFHPELEPGTVTQWMQDPANIACASEWLGSEQAAWDFVQATEAQADGFLARSAALYAAFRKLV